MTSLGDTHLAVVTAVSRSFFASNFAQVTGVAIWEALNSGISDHEKFKDHMGKFDQIHWQIQ